MQLRQHWDRVYALAGSERVSWFRPHLETSLALIERALSGDRAASVVDAGGGASTLVDDLLERGFRHIAVLDISQAALDIARQRLGPSGASVQWLRADLREPVLLPGGCDLWHDRAVFHFLTAQEDRIAYVRNVSSALRPGGYIVIGTFGPVGPMKCSGLEVVRYDAETLYRQFGGHFRLVETVTEAHQTPFGTMQQFVYCTLQAL